MFEKLLDFVAQLSIGVWGLVIITLVMRFIGVHAYRRLAARPASAETALSSTGVQPTSRTVPTVRIDVSRPVDGQPADSGLVHLGLLGPMTAVGDAMTASYDSGKRPADTHEDASHGPRTGHGSAPRVPELAASSPEA